MANTPQSKKRARQTVRRTLVNRGRRSRIRSYVRKVEEAISTGNSEAAREALNQVQPELDRGVTKGILHANTASRKLSRLSARVKSM